MEPLCDHNFSCNLSSRFFRAKNSSGSKNSKNTIATYVHAITTLPKKARKASYFIKKARDALSLEPVIATSIHAIACYQFLVPEASTLSINTTLIISFKGWTIPDEENHFRRRFLNSFSDFWRSEDCKSSHTFSLEDWSVNVSFIWFDFDFWPCLHKL